MKNKLPRRLYSPILPRPDAPEGEPVRAIAFDTPELEADFIAREISERANGDFNQFAVCYRMRAVGSWIERALMFKQIPFINLNGTSFWKIKHIQIAWQYIAMNFGNKKQQVDGYHYTYRIASDRMVQPSALRSRETGTVLKAKGQRISHRWIGQVFLKNNPTYAKAARQIGMGGWKGAGVEDLVYTYKEINKLSWRNALDWVVTHVVIPWYVSEHGTVNDQEGSFADDMSVLREMADGYNTAEEFLGFIEKVLAMTKSKEDKNAVILGTFHKVKGGEWDTVFVAGMSEMICPTPYALGMAPPVEQGYLPPPPSNSGIIDERFCFYVGVTRARFLVFVTCPLFWRNKRVEPSRFISEAGLQLEYENAN